jgi:hypothetical protein
VVTGCARVLSTTFLGHQGWLFRSDRACVAVDPLLCETFGAQHALDYQVFPPRRLDLARFPALDAVVLTHEHDDHFDIPSLAKLSRKIQVHLSARSSSAAHAILREMGFRVVPLEPGVPVTFGDLEVVPLAGDHVNVDCGDEWDTLPFLVRDAGGAGSFFSMVDITPTERHLHLVRGVVAKPGLVTWTNNALDWSHMTDFAFSMTGSTEACAARMAVGRDLVREVWGRPAAMLLCAGGFSFQGERAWLNQRVFPIDCERACASLQRAHPREKFVSALPGQTFCMEGNRLVRVDPSTDFLATEPRDAWPSREPAPLPTSPDGPTLPDFAPGSGARGLARGDLARLEAGLNELAAALVGGPLFRCLHSLMAGESEGRRPTFAFALRDGARRHVFEYVPSACAFRRVAVDDPETAYLLGLECWATDMLRVLRGDFGPIALTFGRARLWNAAPDVVPDVIFDEMSRVSHPLRRPAETLRAYQRLWKSVGSVRPRVAGKKRGVSAS